MTRCRALDGIAESNNSIRLTISNGKRVQFDGFWDREVCLELLQVRRAEQRRGSERAGRGGGMASACFGYTRGTHALSDRVWMQ